MPHFTVNMGNNIHLEKAVLSTINVHFWTVRRLRWRMVWVGANVTIATPCHPSASDERLPQQYPDGFHDLEYAKPIHIGSGS